MQVLPRRMDVLDAMRGIAALLVVFFHARNYIFSVGLVPGGYLAVDFFFALSGLVIAQAYSKRLNNDMGPVRFFALRLIRLYPLFFLGLFFGVINASIGTMDTPMSASEIVRLLVPEIFMLPAIGASELFPLNGPAWSLFFEIIINLVFAIWLVNVRIRTLVLVVVSSTIALMFTAWSAHGLGTGYTWPTFFGGLARVFFSFTIGVLIFRLQLHERFKVGSLQFVVPVTTLAIAMTIPMKSEFRAIFDLLVVIALFPMLVILGASCRMPKWCSAIARFFGDTSYAIYVIHLPLLYITGTTMRNLHVSALIWLPLFLVGIFWLAYVVDKFYDLPTRRWLQSASAKRSGLGC